MRLARSDPARIARVRERVGPGGPQDRVGEARDQLELAIERPLDLDRIPHAAAPAVVHAQREVGAVGGGRPHLPADRDVLGVVRVGVGVAGRQVALVAVAQLEEPAQPGGDAVLHDGDVQREPPQPLLVGADLDVAEQLELVGRGIRDGVDRAARRVAPVERPLRAAEHLDPRDVEEGQRRGKARVVLVDAVDVEGRRRVRAECRRDPADRDACQAELDPVVEVRNLEGEVLELADAGRVELAPGEGRDGDGGVLDVRLSLAAGDDDLLDPLGWIAEHVSFGVRDLAGRRGSFVRWDRTGCGDDGHHGTGGNGPIRVNTTHLPLRGPPRGGSTAA